MTGIAIETEALEKRYGPIRALRALSTAVESGTRVRVAGSNGAGKSTLLRVLAGLTRPTRGSVRVLGSDPFRSDAARVRGRIGYLGASAGLYGDLTVRENLAFCARLHGLPTTRIDETLQALDLGEVRDRRADALSSGYLRRAGLARIWLGEPDLLLLDEPWNGLDDRAAERLDALLEQSRERRATVLVAAHAVEGRGLTFDRTLFLEAGRLLPAASAV